MLKRVQSLVRRSRGRSALHRSDGRKRRLISSAAAVSRSDVVGAANVTKPIIQDLTPDQEAQLAVYEQRWIAHGLDCSPMNWKAAMAAIDSAYEVAGLKAPKMVVACASPFGMLAGRDYKKLRGRGKPPTVPDRSQVFYGQHNA